MDVFVLRIDQQQQRFRRVELDRNRLGVVEFYEHRDACYIPLCSFMMQTEGGKYGKQG